MLPLFLRCPLTFLHSGGLAPLHNRHRLARVNLVRTDGVSVQISAAFHREGLAVQLNLKGLHDLWEREKREVRIEDERRGR